MNKLSNLCKALAFTDTVLTLVPKAFIAFCKGSLMTCVLAIMAYSGSLQAAGNAELGQEKSISCVGCHGVDGNSVVTSFPKLAGQGERYLIEQITAIQSGERPVPQMMLPSVDALTTQDIEDIAAYYAAQEPSLGEADPALVEAGEKLYRGGNMTKGIAACSGCHSPTGAGNAQAGFPALRGQHADYVVAQLQNYRAGKRTTPQALIMNEVAAILSDDEIAAVASYVQGLY